MKKQIAGALVFCVLAGTTPGWTETRSMKAPNSAPAGSALRGSIAHAVDLAVTEHREIARSETATAGASLTSEERQDLVKRKAALQKDPVARGAGTTIMWLLMTAVSVGGTIYLIHELKKNNDNNDTAQMARR